MSVMAGGHLRSLHAIQKETAVSPRRSRRDAILTAAAQLVKENGAAHLTLDSVSARANVSKGGLLYHFKTKESLILGMLDRLKEQIDSVREQELAKLPPSPARKLKAHVIAMQVLQHEDTKALVSALLVAGVHNPEFLARKKMDEDSLIREMGSRGFRPAFVRVIVFAAIGWCLEEMLGVSSHSRKERRDFFDELIRLIGAEEGRMST